MNIAEIERKHLRDLRFCAIESPYDSDMIDDVELHALEIQAKSETFLQRELAERYQVAYEALKLYTLGLKKEVTVPSESLWKSDGTLAIPLEAAKDYFIEYAEPVAPPRVKDHAWKANDILAARTRLNLLDFVHYHGRVVSKISLRDFVEEFLCIHWGSIIKITNEH